MRLPMLNAVVLVAATADSLACAARLADRAASPAGSCPPGRVANYMATRAQQCWYATPQGRWRIVNHEFHYDVLVVQTEASTLEMTGEIVSRLAEVHGGRFVEILIYVRAGSASPATTIRRARWTEGRPRRAFRLPGDVERRRTDIAAAASPIQGRPEGRPLRSFVGGLNVGFDEHWNVADRSQSTPNASRTLPGRAAIPP